MSRKSIFMKKIMLIKRNIFQRFYLLFKKDIFYNNHLFGWKSKKYKTKPSNLQTRTRIVLLWVEKPADVDSQRYSFSFSASSMGSILIALVTLKLYVLSVTDSLYFGVFVVISTLFLNHRIDVGCGYPDTEQKSVTESLTYVLKISLLFKVYVSRANAESVINGLSVLKIENV